MLGPTMLGVVDQQCCVHLHGPISFPLRIDRFVGFRCVLTELHTEN